MAVDSAAINSEVRTVIGALDVSWTDFVIYVKAKIMEAGIAGGVAAYTINGRSVTKDLRWWNELLALAQAQAAVEQNGGFASQEIYFSPRCGGRTHR